MGVSVSWEKYSQLEDEFKNIKSNNITFDEFVSTTLNTNEWRVSDVQDAPEAFYYG